MWTEILSRKIAALSVAREAAGVGRDTSYLCKLFFFTSNIWLARAWMATCHQRFAAIILPKMRITGGVAAVAKFPSLGRTFRPISESKKFTR